MTNQNENQTQIESVKFLFPTESTIKIVLTKKGIRYYKGDFTRFFPLSKKDFKKLDLTEYHIYQQIENEFFKIN